MRMIQKLAQLQEWLERTKKYPDRSDLPGDEFDRLIDETAPSGSGFDAGTQFKTAKFDKRGNCARLDFQTDFHRLNGMGYYVGWTRYEISVFPTFSGFDFVVKGKNADGLRDYVGEVFQDWFDMDVTE